jgi:hypothetical protein
VAHRSFREFAPVSLHIDENPIPALGADLLKGIFEGGQMLHCGGSLGTAFPRLYRAVSAEPMPVRGAFLDADQTELPNSAFKSQ